MEGFGDRWIEVGIGRRRQIMIHECVPYGDSGFRILDYITSFLYHTARSMVDIYRKLVVQSRKISLLVFVYFYFISRNGLGGTVTRFL